MSFTQSGDDVDTFSSLADIKADRVIYHFTAMNPPAPDAAAQLLAMVTSPLPQVTIFSFTQYELCC